MSDEKVTVTLRGGRRDGQERTLPGPPQEFRTIERSGGRTRLLDVASRI